MNIRALIGAVFVRDAGRLRPPEQGQCQCRQPAAAAGRLHRKSLEIVELGGGPGFLGGGHQIATDSKGNIYVAATGPGPQKLAFRGMK